MFWIDRIMQASNPFPFNMIKGIVKQLFLPFNPTPTLS
jgi:hypothetical protein